MEKLSSVLVKNSQAGEPLLLAAYREPAITAYNRLEPRPRTENFARSLRAEVRDPLWMLTRQWQMGELEAEDAGSAIDARLLTRHRGIDRIAVDGATDRPYDETIPLEAFVERETIPMTYALKAQIGQYFLRLHDAALRGKYRQQYLDNFGMAPGQEAAFRGQQDGLNLYVATGKTALDGDSLLGAIRSGDLYTTIVIDPGAPDDLAALKAIGDQLLAWFARQYTQPAKPAESAWHPRQLDYQFKLTATDGARPKVVLKASQYREGHLDWYAFDNVVLSEAGARAPDATPDQPPISFLPTPAEFKGIPNARFWEMEDRQINFGQLNAKTTDQLLLLFAEFGLVYGNDWFVIPYKLPVNTLCEVRGLVVTDVFGDRTLIRAADEAPETSWQAWSMFNLSNDGNMAKYNRLFFLPATVGDLLESDPIEQVNLMRDEMANMVWGVEDVIPDATGRGIDGHEAADKTGVDPPPIVDSPAKIRYLLGTTVPENWIPFLPVHKPGSVEDVDFQRAAMPKLGDPPRDVIRAKGVVLTEVPSPYLVNEEEVPNAGTIVTRSYQRTRWYDGKTYLWVGRRSETGRGSGNSRLRFDQILSPKKNGP